MSSEPIIKRVEGTSADACELIAAFAVDSGIQLDWPTRAALPGLLERHGAIIYLAHLDGVPVGVIVCQLTMVTFQGGDALNVHDLFVNDDARGHGVGRRLLERAIAHARSLGCVRVTLEVGAANSTARSLYSSCGFDLPEAGHDATHFLRLPLD